MLLRRIRIITSTCATNTIKSHRVASYDCNRSLHCLRCTSKMYCLICISFIVMCLIVCKWLSYIILIASCLWVVKTYRSNINIIGFICVCFFYLFHWNTYCFRPWHTTFLCAKFYYPVSVYAVYLYMAIQLFG